MTEAIPRPAASVFRTSRTNHNGNIPVLPKTLKCPVCEGMYTRMNHLQRHMLSHSQNRRHTCEYCQAGFTRRDVLKRHMKTCDGSSASTPRPPPPPVSCEACAHASDGCDMQKPRCGPCAVQGRLCVYKLRRKKRTATPEDVPTVETAITPPSDTPTSAVVSPIERGHQSQSPQSQHSDTSSDRTCVEARHGGAMPNMILARPSIEAEYERLFQINFSESLLVPLFHHSSRDLGFFPPSTRRAMQACGSVHAQDTEFASRFVVDVITEMHYTGAREMLEAQGNLRQQIALAAAVIMTQKVVQLYASPEVRKVTRFLHGSVALMVRESRLIDFVQTWSLPYVIEDVEAVWMDWVTYESAKRVIALAFEVDNCHSVVWGSPPLLAAHETDVPLICNRDLWEARSAQEWYSLVCSSPTTSIPEVSLLQVVYLLETADLEESAPLLGRFNCRNALTLISYINCVINVTITQYAQRCETAPMEADEASRFYRMLQNWMVIWTAISSASPQRLPIADKVMALYWLAHVSLWALQSQSGATLGKLTTDRVAVVARWFWQIRLYLMAGTNDTLRLWDDLLGILDEIKEAGCGSSISSDNEQVSLALREYLSLPDYE
ncbi:hypothetical protein CYLTODRAFT_444651 [Cylindrobasidium torrendii FP15055 ss-10]|uniref:C2H2-type domain-containing protein n=1 Tax=Cylindrobasidium torrendii FP15055 ss-10 TaxID=1314674 RepID=A0A0D7B7F2_9AGAR|nr:hypothetical protein CYLTODRAFT_444651 [Cylindrobasidium torrendii FP15055 ss-10]